MTKLKFKSDIFKSSNKSTFNKFVISFFYYFFYVCIQMSKNLSAKYYQENIERLQERGREKRKKETVWS